MIQSIHSALLLGSLLLSLLWSILLSLRPLLSSVLLRSRKSKWLLLLLYPRLLLIRLLLPQRLCCHWWSWGCISHTLPLFLRAVFNQVALLTTLKTCSCLPPTLRCRMVFMTMLTTSSLPLICPRLLRLLVLLLLWTLLLLLV